MQQRTKTFHFLNLGTRYIHPHQIIKGLNMMLKGVDRHSCPKMFQCQAHQQPVLNHGLPVDAPLWIEMNLGFKNGLYGSRYSWTTSHTWHSDMHFMLLHPKGLNKWDSHSTGIPQNIWSTLSCILGTNCIWFPRRRNWPWYSQARARSVLDACSSSPSMAG